MLPIEERIPERATTAGGVDRHDFEVMLLPVPAMKVSLPTPPKNRSPRTTNTNFGSSSNKDTILPESPKDEVACGLVLSKQQINLIVPDDLDSGLIAGEACGFDQGSCTWDSRLRFPRKGPITRFYIPELPQLKKFVKDFNQALADLKMDDIVPDHYYARTTTDNEDLWNSIAEDLKAYLNQTMNRDAQKIRQEPTFIMGLKALLRTLGRQTS